MDIVQNSLPSVASEIIAGVAFAEAAEFVRLKVSYFVIGSDLGWELKIEQVDFFPFMHSPSI